MDEKTIRQHIDDLVVEEKKLRSGHTGLDEDGRQRLHHLEEQLDQAWDLLRQRRARAEMGQDPDEAAERTASEVESYWQ